MTDKVKYSHYEFEYENIYKCESTFPIFSIFSINEHNGENLLFSVCYEYLVCKNKAAKKKLDQIRTYCLEKASYFDSLFKKIEKYEQMCIEEVEKWKVLFQKHNIQMDFVLQKHKSIQMEGSCASLVDIPQQDQFQNSSFLNSKFSNSLSKKTTDTMNQFQSNIVEKDKTLTDSQSSFKWDEKILDASFVTIIEEPETSISKKDSVDSISFSSVPSSKELIRNGTSKEPVSNKTSKFISSTALKNEKVKSNSKNSLLACLFGKSKKEMAGFKESMKTLNQEQENSKLPSSRKKSNFSIRTTKSSFFTAKQDQIGPLGQMIQLYCASCILIDVFISTCSKFEININGKTRNSVQNLWQELEIKYSLFRNELEWTREKWTWDEEKMKTQVKQLFQFPLDEVNFMLSDDVFSRFKRSASWIQFVESKTHEQIIKFGKLRGNHELQAWLLSPEDMSRYLIKPQDVYMSMLFLKDFYHWKCIHHSSKMNLHTTNISVLSDEAVSLYGHLQTFKVSCDFNTDAYHFLQVFLQKNNYMLISELTDVKCLEYIPIQMNANSFKDHFNKLDTTVSSPQTLLSTPSFDSMKTIPMQDSKKILNFGTTILYQERNHFPIRRDFVQSSTVYYDSEKKTYIYIFKHCVHPKQPNIKPHFIRGISNGIIAVTELSPFKCRYTAIFMVNLRGMLENSSNAIPFLTQKLMISHVSGSLKKIDSLIQKSEESKQEFKDELNLLRPLHEYYSCMSMLAST